MQIRPGAAPAVLVLAVLLGAAFRLERLGSAELTTDEAFSWRMATYPPGEIVARTAADVHPPLYYLVLAGWRRLAGDSPSALRGLSALSGMGVIALGFLLARELERPTAEGG